MKPCNHEYHLIYPDKMECKHCGLLKSTIESMESFENAAKISEQIDGTVQGFCKVIQISQYTDHVMALKSDGSLWEYGRVVVPGEPDYKGDDFHPYREEKWRRIESPGEDK